ncbi:hypothetical protein TRVL_05121 [Trypanosoma vivax]|nr:hypothetical protein TRVL_05121 [Trypanosoma vivax]
MEVKSVVTIPGAWGACWHKIALICSKQHVLLVVFLLLGAKLAVWYQTRACMADVEHPTCHVPGNLESPTAQQSMGEGAKCGAQCRYRIVAPLCFVLFFYAVLHHSPFITSLFPSHHRKPHCYYNAGKLCKGLKRDIADGNASIIVAAPQSARRLALFVEDPVTGQRGAQGRGGTTGLCGRCC